ncbi:MAG: M20/M25/M40 family metallo-hydrolase, partial [Planctomycetota bacterium]
MSAIDEYLAAHAGRFELELCRWLRIPSVSTDPTCRDDMDRAAEWVAGQFRRLDFATEIIQTSGHPLVLAQSPPVEGAPTVLIYGHYDVQPPEPLDEWVSPPFTPTRRNGSLYARGATDDKGQLLTHMFSAEAWIAVEQKLPVNLKYLIEGEEESGSA